MGKLKIRRIGYALGTEITGFDATRPIDDETVAEIRQAWIEHPVICFSGQDLVPSTLQAFCSRFGPLDDMRRTPDNRHPDHATVAMLSNKPVDVKGVKTGGKPYGLKWHSDRQFTDRPATASFLNAKILPSVGGDTAFANMYMAYETLSAALQSIVDGLEAIHDTTLGSAFAARSLEAKANQARLNPPVIHPVVRVHPESGRKALFVGDYIRSFVGMTEEESQPLLSYLNEHAVRYEFVYRHRWTVGDLVMWDNRCTMHRAIADYDPSELRQLIRCALLAPKSGRVAVTPQTEAIAV